MEDSDVQSPDRTALKQPLDVKFVPQTANGRVNYDQTWPELRANAASHPTRLVLTLHAMAHTIAMEDEAKRKLYGRAGDVAARLTAEELEKVFGGDQGAAWVPTTGTKGRRSFQDWILRTEELCKKALVKTKQPAAGDIVHYAIGTTNHYKGLVESLSMTAIDEANNIMCDRVHSHDCVTSVLATRSHRCALSKPTLPLTSLYRSLTFPRL
jgi:hypothetical protein